MIIFSGWVKGYCHKEAEITMGSYDKMNITQVECEDFCKNIPGSTGCQYYKRGEESWCHAFKYAVHAVHENDLNSDMYCLTFEKRNTAARKRTPTPGKLTRPYKTYSHQLN